jgi:hypothetical protein
MVNAASDASRSQEPEKRAGMQLNTASNAYGHKIRRVQSDVLNIFKNGSVGKSRVYTSKKHTYSKPLNIETENKVIRTDAGLKIKNISVDVVKKAAALVVAVNNGAVANANKIMQSENQDTILAVIGMCLRSPQGSELKFLYDLKYHLNKNFPGVDSILLDKAIKDAVTLEKSRFEIMANYESKKADLSKEKRLDDLLDSVTPHEFDDILSELRKEDELR